MGVRLQLWCMGYWNKKLKPFPFIFESQPLEHSFLSPAWTEILETPLHIQRSKPHPLHSWISFPSALKHSGRCIHIGQSVIFLCFLCLDKRLSFCAFHVSFGAASELSMSFIARLPLSVWVSKKKHTYAIYERLEIIKRADKGSWRSFDVVSLGWKADWLEFEKD